MAPPPTRLDGISAEGELAGSGEGAQGLFGAGHVQLLQLRAGLVPVGVVGVRVGGRCDVVAPQHHRRAPAPRVRVVVGVVLRYCAHMVLLHAGLLLLLVTVRRRLFARENAEFAVDDGGDLASCAGGGAALKSVIYLMI